MNPTDAEEDENTVESVILRFSGFIAGIFLFFWFLTSMETSQLFLFLAFIGLMLGLGSGFTAWEGYASIQRAREKTRSLYR